MITKTIGAGGDYADINAFINDYLNVALLDDVTGNVINNHTVTTAPSGWNWNNRLKPNNFTFSINLNGYEITLNQSIELYLVRDCLNGTCEIHNGTIKTSSLIGFCIKCERAGTYTATHSIHDIKFIIEVGQVSAILINRRDAGGIYINTRIYNVSIYATSTSSAIVTYELIAFDARNYGFSDIFDDIGTLQHYVENVSIYLDDFFNTFINGAMGLASWSHEVSAKNIVVVNKVGLSPCFGTNGTATISNCACSDGSLISGSNSLTGITASDFLSVDPSSSDFLKINDSSALFEVGTTSISAWNTSDPLGHTRPNSNSKVSIGFYEPYVPVKRTIRFFNGSNSIEINRPSYGYQCEIHMPIYTANKHPSGYAFFDADNTGGKDYRVLVMARWQLPIDQKAMLNNFLRDVSGGRCENITMSLGATPTGFFPFGPDLGDVGDFTVRLLSQNQSGILMSPLKYFEDELSLVLVSAPTPPAAPSITSQGNFQIGTVTGLLYPQTTFRPTSQYNLQTGISRTGSPYSIDGNNSGDSWETKFYQQCNTSLAVALVNFMESTSGRASEIDIMTDLNYYAFGIDQGGSAHYIAQFLGSSKSSREIVLKITHERYNRFTIPMSFWMSGIVGSEIDFGEGEILIPEGELSLS